VNHAIERVANPGRRLDGRRTYQKAI